MTERVVTSQVVTVFVQCVLWVSRPRRLRLDHTGTIPRIGMSTRGVMEDVYKDAMGRWEPGIQYTTPPPNTPHVLQFQRVRNDVGRS